MEESLVSGSAGFMVVVASIFLGAFFLGWSVFCKPQEEIGNKDYRLWSIAGYCTLVLAIIFCYVNDRATIGSVRTEVDLVGGVVYVVTYSSELPVENNCYLVKLYQRFYDSSGKKSLRAPRIYLLPIKPPTSFYVTEVEGKIKYSDAVEVR